MDADQQRWARQRLRMLRAKPPGRAASSNARQELVSASLQQFEELLAAAATVSPAARPLPLFYALSQATRAICAARLPNDFLLARHGLSWQAAQGPVDLMHRVVAPEPHRSASFTRLCAALGCDALSAPIALGALWRALPDLAVPPLPAVEPDWQSALFIRAPRFDERPRRCEEVIEVVIGPVPPDIGFEQLRTILSRFRGLTSFQPVATAEGELPARTLIGHTQTGAVVRTNHSPAPSRAELHAAVDRLAGPSYHGDPNTRYLLPELPSGDQLAVLALWWAVLFALSNLARYEPDTWSKALNVDRSLLAVPLEDCVSEAVVVLPHLVLEALLGHPVRAHTYA